MELRRITRLGEATSLSRRAPVRVRVGARWPARRQAGLGLLESIVALALLSTVILALASGMLALLSTSRSNAQTQRLEAAVTAWTEAAKVLPYVRCASGYDLAQQGSVWAPPTVGTARVTQVEHLQLSGGTSSTTVPASGSTSTTTAAPAFVPPVNPCSGDGGAQRLTLRVCLEQQATTAQVVIRQPWPPPASTTTTTTTTTATTTTVPTTTTTTVPTTTEPCP